MEGVGAFTGLWWGACTLTLTALQPSLGTLAVDEASPGLETSLWLICLSLGLRPVLNLGSHLLLLQGIQFPHQTPASHSGCWSQKQAPLLFLLPVVGFSLPLLPIPIPQPLPPAWQLVQDTEFCPFHRGTLRVRENSCPVRGGGEASCFHPLRTGFPNFPIPAPVEQKASGPVCWAGPSKGTHQRLFIESSRQARHSIKNPFPFVPPGPQLSPLSCDGRSQL